MLLVVSRVAGAVLGAFMTFAGVSKLSGGGPMGAEMRAGFVQNQAWEHIWGNSQSNSKRLELLCSGMPGWPFLYAVGLAELLSGPPLLAAAFGLNHNSSTILSSVTVMAITAGATASHIIRGDPPAAISFCSSVFTLSVFFTFSYASTLTGKVKIA